MICMKINLLKRKKNDNIKHKIKVLIKIKNYKQLKMNPIKRYEKCTYCHFT
jgi:hypothetical protein